MITPEDRKKELSEAYVKVVAGSAGMSCSFRRQDYGIDVTLDEVAWQSRPPRPDTRHVDNGYKLDIQIKSTTTATVRDEVIVCDLDMDTYDDLRETQVGTPRILVLFVLPKSETEQVEQTEDSLCLRRCCYWLSLRGKEEKKNKSTVRVKLPRENVFSADALREIMERVKQGQSL